MSLDNILNNSFESPTEQLGLFSSENSQYIESIKKTIDDFLNYDNKIFSNKDTELYLIDKQREWNSVNATIVCKLTTSNNIKSFFQLKVTIDTFKKFIYVDHKGTKWIEWIRVNMPFMWEDKEDILKSILDESDNVQEYHFATKKPKDVSKKEVQENPKVNFSDTHFEINWNKTTIFFHLNGYDFRVTWIETTSVQQRNWWINDNSELIKFNKLCLNNIWIHLDNWVDKPTWQRFTSSKFKFYEFYRSEISKHIFNELNSCKYNEALEKSL